MAASLRGAAKLLWRLTPLVLEQQRIYQPCLQRLRTGAALVPSHTLCQAAAPQDEALEAQALEAQARYRDKPWEYLSSEEYIEKYGSDPVWSGYRRNHKGGIPPQKTRKTCIRGDQICGNPCPICRDPNIIVHHQNVQLLEQFISPYTGMLHDPTKTGVCMKQQKKLSEAIDASRDHGFLPFQVPYVAFTTDDYSNRHAAVGLTPPPPSLGAGRSWYTWYEQITPDQDQVAKVKRKYKAYLK